jgi:alpha-tubulin suppressor-like RCC1 family protein
VAVAAGQGQDLALLSNGTCVAWGFTNVGGMGAAYGAMVPTNLNLTNIDAIACGWGFNLALRSNGTVVAWGNDEPGIWNLTNVPSDLTTNVAAIAAGGLNSLALRKDGTVEGWGDSESGDTVTNVPAGLSNVVAIATGGQAGLALQANGTVVAWGESSLTNIPAGMTGVKAISAGFDHNVVIESGIVTPVLFTQPTNQYAPAGGTVTFSVAGAGVAGLQYQWQFNGVDITGATNVTLTLSNVGATNNGSYQAIITTDAGPITTEAATFTLVLAPVITFATPTNAGITWFNYDPTLSISTYAADPSGYPLSYAWQLNGTNIAGTASGSYLIPSLTSTKEGNYSVTVSNVVGGTNMTWDLLLALPGMVEAWGDDAYGECNRPATVTNVAGIAAGEYQSVAVTDSGTVVQWGQYTDDSGYYFVTNFSHCSAPPASGVVAVAAGLGQALALMTNGTVVAWGLTNDEDGYAAYGTQVPTNLNLTNVVAVACGWEFNVALLGSGTVKSWGLPSFDGYSLTTVPSGLSNVTAIATGPLHTLALQSNGTVAAWGYNDSGETTVPTGLTNIVAIAAGLEHSLALSNNGTVVAWGGNDYGQTNVPAGLTNVMAIAAGDYHSVALLNNGTIVEWGDNSSGQPNVPSELPNTVVTISGGPGITYTTNTYPPIVVKLIAAGGDHTLASIFSPWVQYPVHVSKDLLLIYNTNSIDSSNVCQYYLTHRPMVSNANVLAIGCETNEQVANAEYTTNIAPQIQNWLANNPTKRPSYVILFEDIPSRPDADGSAPSTQVQINSTCETNWHPFITSINMNGAAGTNDCIAYINKVVNMGNSNPPGTIFISATATGYGNTNWFFDDSRYGGGIFQGLGIEAQLGVLAANPSASVYYSSNSIITNATNVAGYYSPGTHNGLFTAGYPTNGQIIFSGSSGWYLIQTDESYNGQRDGAGLQGDFIEWYSSNAFGGSFYSCTPIGAVCHVEEPGSAENNPYIYFGLWAQGKTFASCAWNSFYVYPNGPGTMYLQVVGDPFVTK